MVPRLVRRTGRCQGDRDDNMATHLISRRADPGRRLPCAPCPPVLLPEDRHRCLGKPGRGRPTTDVAEVAKQTGGVTTKKHRGRSPGPVGPGPRALKEMREEVKFKKGFPNLSQKRMALETGIGSQSSYQYYEDDFVGDYFDISQVTRLMKPLVERGLNPAMVKRRLLGDVSVKVSFSPGEWRPVPVISRDALGRIARGEINLDGIARMDPDVLGHLQAEGVILGWKQIWDAPPGALVFDVHDGTGKSQVVVDRSIRGLVFGKSYVYACGPDLSEFVLAKLGPEGMAACERDGRPVPFDPLRDYLVGQVVMQITRM